MLLLHSQHILITDFFLFVCLFVYCFHLSNLLKNHEHFNDYDFLLDAQKVTNKGWTAPNLETKSKLTGC